MIENKYATKEKAKIKAYVSELSLSIALYIIVLIASLMTAKSMEPGALRTLLVLTPLLPALGVVWAIVRYIKRVDEYLRTWMSENMALAGGITCFLSFSYGFMEGLGYPRLNGFVYYSVFMLCWLVTTFVRKFLER